MRYYGQWMRDEAEKRIGHLTRRSRSRPRWRRTRPDLKPYVGQKLTVIAWLWARTVKSPNPAFANVDVPLASTFMLSTKAGKEAYVEPVIEDGRLPLHGEGGQAEGCRGGEEWHKASRGAQLSVPDVGDADCRVTISSAEGKAGRMGARLMAIVAEGDRGRVYLAPTPEHEAAALNAKPSGSLDTDCPRTRAGSRPPPYGLTTYGDLFTPRQLVALTTFSESGWRSSRADQARRNQRVLGFFARQPRVWWAWRPAPLRTIGPGS